MILLGHRRLQYIGEEPLGVAGGWGGTLGAGAPVALGGKKPGLWAGPTSRRRRPNGQPNTLTYKFSFRIYKFQNQQMTLGITSRVPIASPQLYSITYLIRICNLRDPLSESRILSAQTK
jgi:hypothetical protein